MSFSGVALPANVMRCGGSVGEALGNAGVGGPEALGVGTPEAPGDGLTPDAEAVGEADALTGIDVGGGGADGFGVGVGGGVPVSRSATFNLNVVSFVPAL